MAADAKKKKKGKRGGRILTLAEKYSGEDLVNVLTVAMGKSLAKAYKRAQSQNSFKPLASLKDAMKILKVDENVQAVSRDAVTAKLRRTEAVSDDLWNAILDRASKIGAPTGKASNHEAAYALKADDATDFLAAVREVPGMSVA